MSYRMRTYLRFTPEEFAAISLACRPLHLNGKPLPLFKHFLVESLRMTSPELAGRVALFRPHEVGILHDDLRARQGHRPARRTRLTRGERAAVSRASSAYLLPDGFPHAFQEFLLQRFRDSFPRLARKVARLTEQEVEDLYRGVRSPGRP